MTTNTTKALLGVYTKRMAYLERQLLRQPDNQAAIDELNKLKAKVKTLIAKLESPIQYPSEEV